MDENLSKVIWMSWPIEESLVTNGPFIIHSRPETVLLNVADTLHDQANWVENNTGDIPACSECWLRVPSDVRGVQDGDGQWNGPDPDHLEYPKSKEWEELVPFVIESIIFAGLDNSEEQESGESETPDHNEERADDLACIVMPTERKCDDS